MNLLKRLLLSFRIRILQNIVDERLWRFTNDDIEKYALLNNVDKGSLLKYYPFLDIPDILTTTEKYSSNYRYCFTEYIYEVKEEIVIEPKFHWLIQKRNREIIKKSMHFCDDPWNPQKLPKPSYINYQLFSEKIHLPKALTVRFLWGNYYHFFYDTLTQILLFDKHVNDPNIPILVPGYIKDVPYIKEFMEISNLLTHKNLVFVQQRANYYISEAAYFVKAKSIDHELTTKILNSIDQRLFELDPENSNRKIFLTRDKNKIRSIKNIDQILDIVTNHGFEIIDTEKMKLKDQIKLFANTSEVIGVHGAGLTNLIFRNGAPLKLFEIFNKEVTPEFYQRICTQFDYKYYSMIGGASDHNDKQRFELDPEEFEKQLLIFESIQLN